MPRTSSKKPSAKASKDTYDGLFFFYPSDAVNYYLTVEKPEIDALLSSQRAAQGRMARFWESLESQTGFLPSSAFVNPRFWSAKLREAGCGGRVPEFEALAAELDALKRRIRSRNLYARTMHGAIRKAPTKEKRAEAIEKVRRAVAEGAERKQASAEAAELAAADEYVLEERALAILDSYPADEVAFLVGCAGDGNGALPGFDAEAWRASVQGDLLLLQKIIQQLKSGVQAHGWAVDIPDLSGEEYGHVNTLLEAEVFSTKELSESKKKALVKQAEKELIEELKDTE